MSPEKPTSAPNQTQESTAWDSLSKVEFAPSSQPEKPEALAANFSGAELSKMSIFILKTLKKPKKLSRPALKTSNQRERLLCPERSLKFGKLISRIGGKKLKAVLKDPALARIDFPPLNSKTR